MDGHADTFGEGGVLELIDLRRTFGPVRALDGLSFAVAPGELFGFVGRNGAGKTTTMRIVCGLLAADSGTVRWRGQSIDSSAREQIGYMPEEPHGRESSPVDAGRRDSPIRRIRSADRLLRFGVAAILTGGAFILTDGAGVVEIVLVVLGLLLIAAREWGKRNAPRPSG
jgi:ABC-type dipeptide/oligopeptide/nickel transport system ATPase component